MLTEYIEAAIHGAQFEVIEDGTIFGSIPTCQGVWSNATTEDEARTELRSVLEGWIILGLRLGHDLPVIDGIDITPELVPEIID